MSEETNTESQNDMASDLFYGEPIKDSGFGGNFDDDKDGVRDGAESLTDDAQKSAKQQQQQPAEPPKTDKADQKTGQQEPPAKTEIQDKKVDPESAEAMLFKFDDKGNAEFDINKALGLTQTSDKVFEGLVDPKKEPITQPKEKENIPEWQKRVQERLEREKQMVDNLSLYEHFLIEGINSGFTGQQALQYARAKINEVAKTELERWKYEQEEKRNLEREEEYRKREEMAQMKPRSESIVAALDRELNGNFNKLVFGYMKDGKYVKGEASDDMNMLFTLMHPDMPKGEAMKKAYQDWFIKLTANENTARWITDIAKARLLQKSIPALLKMQRETSSIQSQRLEEGKTKGASKINSPQKGGESDEDSWAKYLSAAPGEKVPIDLIG